MSKKSILLSIVLISLFLKKSSAQNVADTVAKSTITIEKTLTSPAMTGPVTLNPNPLKVGNIYVGGVVSGLVQSESHVARGDKAWQKDISNAQIFIQKNSGLVQFFIEAGAYSQPDLGVPYLRSSLSADAFYGVIPEGYLQIVPTDHFSFMVGKLPAFMGAEPTFSFQNMNIQRGLLWDQSNSINRGVQFNYMAGPVVFALSYNDGFYSNHYNWLSGTVTYTLNSADTFVLMGGGSLSRTDIATSATPLYQNNEQGYNLIYTHTSDSFTIIPYVQYTEVPKATLLKTTQNASAFAAAVLVDYSVPHSGFSLPFRVEWITSTGSAAQGAPGLIYGAGSNAWSATVTPTYQYKRVFVRSEFSYVKAGNTTKGAAFGPLGNDDTQSRVLLETGFVF
jgi:hypothetical protein